MKLLFTFVLMTILSADSVYDFTVNSIDGQPVQLSQFQGKALLIVNVASQCGYTPQYAELEQLHENFGHKVAVLGFPANNFGGQEPGSNSEIAAFCEKNYGVKFPMFEKISVVGADQHPLYKFLKEKTGQEPTWNFCKYLVKPDGSVSFFPSKVAPMSKDIIGAL